MREQKGGKTDMMLRLHLGPFTLLFSGFSLIHYFSPGNIKIKVEMSTRINVVKIKINVQSS